MLAAQIFQSRDVALDTLAREELGVDPGDPGGSAWTAAAASFGLFAAGTIFLCGALHVPLGRARGGGQPAASGVALAMIGALTSFVTGRSIAFSIARQILVGFAAAALTFAVGKVLGVAIS